MEEYFSLSRVSYQQVCVNICLNRYSKFSPLNRHYPKREYFLSIAFHWSTINGLLIVVDMFLALRPIRESYNPTNRRQYVFHQTRKSHENLPLSSILCKYIRLGNRLDWYVLLMYVHIVLYQVAKHVWYDHRHPIQHIFRCNKHNEQLQYGHLTYEDVHLYEYSKH